MNQAAVIGDIVESKRAADRESLQRTFLAVLDSINQTTSPATPLRITRGDEFEGAYASLPEAWSATLRLRLLMRAQGHDLWLSVAWGEVTALPDAEHAGTQDGPAWWTARAALTDLKQSSRAPGNQRTVFRIDRTDQSLLAAASALRDEVLAKLDPADATITLGLLNGATQKSIAAGLGVTPGVVSRRVHRNGLLSLAASANIHL